MQASLASMLREPQPIVGQGGPESVAAEIARCNRRLSAIEQIDIYREQFFVRHVESLREDFRAVEHAAGANGFEQIAKAYLAKHPPASFTMRDLGHALASFLSHDAFLFDVARVEWAFIEAFDAADAAPLDPSTVAAATEDQWPGAKLALHPSLQRLALTYPAHEYRRAVRDGGDADMPAPRESFVVVYRAADGLWFAEIERGAFFMLDEIAAGSELAEACASVARASNVDRDTLESQLARWFQQWTSFGWIATIQFPPRA